MADKKLLSTDDLENPPTEDEDTKAPTSENVFDHYANLSAHTYNLWQKMRTGVFYSTNLSVYGITSATQALTAERLYAMPMVIARATTWDKIAIYVSALDAGSVARLGIYNDGTNLHPGTLLLDAGEISTATTGTKAIVINQALGKGIYWIVVMSDGTPSLRKNTYGINLLGGDGTNPTRFKLLAYKDDSYGALPSPFPADAIYEGNFLLEIGLRLASLD